MSTRLAFISAVTFILAVNVLTDKAHSQTTARKRPLLVISVDGLDYRYLRDCDKLGLKIPTLRRLMREGEVTDGIVGVFPTVTWPSHTTMITGVTPAKHGILSNRRPKAEGGDYYWDASLLKVKTLWHAARKAKLKTAAITWPVTVNAEIDFNLPEYFVRRNGGAMDLKSIEMKATPGLVAKISNAFPSFPQEWTNDRARALATIYLLKYERPDLILLHLVDLDAEAHETGPFSREANAILEYTDELLGQIIQAAPAEMVVAIVSDHGFERIDKVVNINLLLAREKVKGSVVTHSGFLTTKEEEVARFLRNASVEHPEYGVGREIPQREVAEFAPHLADAGSVFESAPHYLFGNATEGDIFSRAREVGVHGLWPNRDNYLATMVLWGGGIRPARLPRTSMLQTAPRFAEILGIPLEVGVQR